MNLLTGLFKGTLRIVAVIVLSVVFLTAFGYAAYGAHEAYKSRQAAPYESMKIWSNDASPPLNLALTARTKLVEGRLYANYRLKGWPAYLADPGRDAENSQRHIVVHFLDKDGFSVYQKTILMSEFSRNVGDDGRPTGLDFQGIEPLDLALYSRFDRVGLEWNLDTSPVVAVAPAASGPWDAYKKVIADPCAPGLSRAERLKRLAQYGAVRETGYNSFSAGLHEVTLAAGSATDVINCR